MPGDDQCAATLDCGLPFLGARPRPVPHCGSGLDSPPSSTSSKASLSPAPCAILIPGTQFRHTNQLTKGESAGPSPGGMAAIESGG
eukprot:764824-Hanusia_phi.AAC.3